MDVKVALEMSMRNQHAFRYQFTSIEIAFDQELVLLTIAATDDKKAFRAIYPACSIE